MFEAVVGACFSLLDICAIIGGGRDRFRLDNRQLRYGSSAKENVPCSLVRGRRIEFREVPYRLVRSAVGGGWRTLNRHPRGTTLRPLVLVHGGVQRSLWSVPSYQQGGG